MKQIILIIGILLMISSVNATCPCSGSNPCNRTVIDYNDTYNLIIESTYLCGDVTGDNVVSMFDAINLRYNISYPSNPNYFLNCNPPIITYYFEQKMINKTINLTTSYDGYIYYNYIDDEYFLNDNGNYLKMGSEEVMPKIYRSFVEFDISDIPKNANVTNVTFKYKGKYHYIICNITNMTVQPSQSNYDFIYNDIGFNTIYTNNTSFPIEGSDKSINLGLYAIEDLQKAINDSNWFSIGIKSCNETITNMSYIYASENVDATPPPALMVEYQVPAEPFREELNIMFHEYNMHINIMTNPLEYIVTKLDNKVGTNIIRPRRCKEDD